MPLPLPLVRLPLLLSCRCCARRWWCRCYCWCWCCCGCDLAREIRHTMSVPFRLHRRTSLETRACRQACLCGLNLRAWGLGLGWAATEALTETETTNIRPDDPVISLNRSPYQSADLKPAKTAPESQTRRPLNTHTRPQISPSTSSPLFFSGMALTLLKRARDSCRSVKNLISERFRCCRWVLSVLPASCLVIQGLKGLDGIGV